MKNIIDEVNILSNDHLIVVDVHGESTSEKMAIAHFLDGKVTAVVGTHTHIPTSDLQILTHGTFYQTDLGMCGDYDSVIGMKKELSIKRFLFKHIKTRLEPAEGIGTLCGVILEIDLKTKGRHDPCVGIRGVPVAEAMLACVLADHKLRHRGQIG